MDGEVADAVATSRGGAGSVGLSAFSHPLTGNILRAHKAGPMYSSELKAQLSWASPTSLRLATEEMRGAGTLVRLGNGSGSRATASELTPSGRGLLEVGGAVDNWLLRAPGEAIEPANPAGPSAVKALIDGWDSTIVHELAKRPVTHSELSSAIPDLSHHSIGRRLAKLHSAGLVSKTPESNGAKRVEPGSWLGQAIAPLCVAARWERTYLDGRARPIGQAEIEAAFLLILPLLRLPSDANGACALAVVPPGAIGTGQDPTLAAVSVVVREGQIVSSKYESSISLASWAQGDLGGWLAAVIDDDTAGLRFHGARARLIRQLVGAIHRLLFPR